MSKLTFKPSPQPTVGVEIELALVDGRTMALSSSISEILDRLPEELKGSIKPELMQCYVEINSGVCRTIGEAETDLHEKVLWLQQTCDELGLRLYWAGTHPFSRWADQQVTPNDRYQRLVGLLQDLARQLVCFGLHVHVGVDSGDKAVMICDRIMRHLPLLLAISCNSPWWEDRMTGLKSHRSKIVEGLPTAGLPPLMRNWSEYVWLVKHLIETGFINSIRELWWDVRPHHSFGTVEVRMCDMPGSLHDVLGIAALTQCLVKALSDMIDEGTYQHDCHPMMVRQNKWRAGRYGHEARLVDAVTHESVPVKETASRLVSLLGPVADQLECRTYLDRAIQMAEGPSWADRQLALHKETGDIAEVVRQFTEQSRLEEPQSLHAGREAR